MNESIMERIAQMQKQASLALPNIALPEDSFYMWCSKYSDAEIAYALYRAGCKLRAKSLITDKAGQFITGVLRKAREEAEAKATPAPTSAPKPLQRPRGF